MRARTREDSLEPLLRDEWTRLGDKCIHRFVGSTMSMSMANPQACATESHALTNDTV
jgi:hypothetical protein